MLSGQSPWRQKAAERRCRTRMPARFGTKYFFPTRPLDSGGRRAIAFFSRAGTGGGGCRRTRSKRNPNPSDGARPIEHRRCNMPCNRASELAGARFVRPLRGSHDCCASAGRRRHTLRSNRRGTGGLGRNIDGFPGFTRWRKCRTGRRRSRARLALRVSVRALRRAGKFAQSVYGRLFAVSERSFSARFRASGNPEGP